MNCLERIGKFFEAVFSFIKESGCQIALAAIFIVGDERDYFLAEILSFLYCLPNFSSSRVALRTLASLAFVFSMKHKNSKKDL